MESKFRVFLLEVHLIVTFGIQIYRKLSDQTYRKSDQILHICTFLCVQNVVIIQFNF